MCDPVECGVERTYAADSLVMPEEDEEVRVVNVVVTCVTRVMLGAKADRGGGACLTVVAVCSVDSGA